MFVCTDSPDHPHILYYILSTHMLLYLVRSTWSTLHHIELHGSIYTKVDMHGHTTHTNTHRNIHTHVHKDIHTHSHTHTHTHTNTHTHTHTHVCILVSSLLYVCISCDKDPKADRAHCYQQEYSRHNQHTYCLLEVQYRTYRTAMTHSAQIYMHAHRHARRHARTHTQAYMHTLTHAQSPRNFK